MINKKEAPKGCIAVKYVDNACDLCCKQNIDKKTFWCKNFNKCSPGSRKDKTQVYFIPKNNVK